MPDRCKHCTSPVDPEGRSLYDFDVTVPMAELRETVAQLEAELGRAKVRVEMSQAEAIMLLSIPKIGDGLSDKDRADFTAACDKLRDALWVAKRGVGELSRSAGLPRSGPRYAASSTQRSRQSATDES